MAGAPPAVAVSGLDLARDGRAVLRDVAVSAPAGRLTAVLGPSGSGKSTLLRCVNRLLEPPAGAVRLDGVDVRDLDVLALRRRVGMVFQQPAALPGTVADNVRYGPRLGGRDLDDGAVAALLRTAALDPALAGRPAGGLSGGEAQRLALARCLANEPQVLLLDEPTSALDPAARAAVGAAVDAVLARGDVTVLWVSHDLEQVRGRASRLALLADGRVVAEGPPDDLLADADGLLARFARGEPAGEAARD